ncbi:YxeA family protein [Enterococcus ureasiticus]|uniref:YxeA family protein n=1 Tax=Enterococcus ureasiticus TaxID=903984 RepID=UPI001A8C5ED9|nr:YxeA family protein [Enterococcus ureasiticus]MBO0473695.1 YxeA family protein [Enterococcus ureasiticus]
MKHFCKTFLMLIAIVVISIIGLRIFTYNNTSTAATMIDYFNPLVKTATLYTKTTEKSDYTYPDAVTKIENFAYVQTCYKNKGEKRKIEYISFGKKLTPDRFIKLTVKGQNVIFWEEIDKKELPEKVMPLL